MCVCVCVCVCVKENPVQMKLEPGSYGGPGKHHRSLEGRVAIGYRMYKMLGDEVGVTRIWSVSQEIRSQRVEFLTTLFFSWTTAVQYYYYRYTIQWFSIFTDYTQFVSYFKILTVSPCYTIYPCSLVYTLRALISYSPTSNNLFSISVNPLHEMLRSLNFILELVASIFMFIFVLTRRVTVSYCILHFAKQSPCQWLLDGSEVATPVWARKDERAPPRGNKKDNKSKINQSFKLFFF